MAFYAATLIIEKKTDQSDSEILEALKLYRLNSVAIGPENSSYQECLSNTDKTFVTKFKDLIIITGLPSITKCYLNRQIPFEEFIQDSPFFIFLSDSTTMHHILCYGENKKYIRRKVVYNGKYQSNQERSDLGKLFQEEMSYFASSPTDDNKANSTSYLFGENDFDIGLQIARRKFESLALGNNTELENLLDTLVFNRNIETELSPAFRKNINDKLKKGVMAKAMHKFFTPNLKALNFSKEQYKAPPPRDVHKMTRFIEQAKINQLVLEFMHTEISQESNMIVFIDDDLNLPSDLEKLLFKQHYIELTCNYPFYSFQLATNHQISTRTSDKIFILSELETALASFEKEIEHLKLIQSAIHDGLANFFSNAEIWNIAINKIKLCTERIGWNAFSPELNFCIAHLYYQKDRSKLSELRNTLEPTYPNLHPTDKQSLSEMLNNLANAL